MTAALALVGLLSFGGLAFLVGWLVGRLGQRREDARRAEWVARREGWRR